MTVDCISIDEFYRPDYLSRIDFSDYKAIVTSLFYFPQLLDRTREIGIPVYPVVLQFKRQTSLAIAHLAPQSKVAILCDASQAAGFALSQIEQLRDDLCIRTGIITEKNNQRDLIEWADCLFAMEPYHKLAMEICPEKPHYHFYEAVNPQSAQILQIQLRQLA